MRDFDTTQRAFAVRHAPICCTIHADEPDHPNLAVKLTVRCRLNPVQLRVLPALGHQFVMGANFNQPRSVEHDDQIGHAHR